MIPGIELRRGTAADSRPCNDLLWLAVTDFEKRFGTPLDGTADEWWASMEPFYRYLAEDAAEWWVAEESSTGTLLGYGRSIDAGGLFELTEFFVRPGHQAKGLGRALLERAFPLGRGEARSIIATRDARALARYYAAGVVARFPILGMNGVPAPSDPEPGLTVSRVDPGARRDVDAIRDVEREVIGFERPEAAERVLLETREAYLYRRGRRIVGSGYLSTDGSGPIAAIDPADMPGILGHLETRAHERGMERLSLEVPAPNEVATRHLLARGFHFEPFISFLMSSRPFGRFDRLIDLGPPLFL